VEHRVSLTDLFESNVFSVASARESRRGCRKHIAYSFDVAVYFLIFLFIAD
jgi:hypothetical protein